MTYLESHRPTTRAVSEAFENRRLRNVTSFLSLHSRISLLRAYIGYRGNIETIILKSYVPEEEKPRDVKVVRIWETDLHKITRRPGIIPVEEQYFLEGSPLSVFAANMRFVTDIFDGKP
ncbi:MAG: hypothetical protein Q8P65_00565 [bacterium]|nr:hypothetical protein [bacterium]